MKKAILIIAFLFLLDFLLKIYVHYAVPIGSSRLMFARNIFFTNTDGDYIQVVHQGFYSFIMITNFVLLLVLLNMMPTIDFTTKKLYSTAVVFYFTGIIGNISDRFFSSFATEYIHIRLFRVTLPMFNLSTLYVLIGVVLIAIDLVKDKIKSNEIKYTKYYIAKTTSNSTRNFTRLTSRGKGVSR